MTDFEARRRRMVDRQIAARGIDNPRVLKAMGRVPREAFVPEQLHGRAYEDCPLPIEADQTISQPYIVALMISSACIGERDRVLEIGAGSGYAAAVMGKLAREVFAIERHPELCQLASTRMRRLGYANVTIRCADGSPGWPEKAPFDAILAAASGSHVPEILVRQLKVGGRLVMPLGEPQSVQKLVKITRRGADEFDEQNLGEVRFVPLIGTHGWCDER